MEGGSRKRTTMMIGSDEEDEGDDTFGELPQPKQKRTEKSVEIDDLAEGPPDFIAALTEAGFHPRANNLPNMLSVQQSDFQQKLRENFLAAVNFPRNVEFFVAECNTFFDDQANFVKALLPTEIPSTDTDAIVLPQDSLIRLLLNIDEVQPKLMRCILKRFEKAAKEQSSSEINLPSVILSQIAWLNHIKEPTFLCDTLLDFLHSCPSNIKKEIMTQLPGLVADCEQFRVACALCDMLEETNSLTAAVLDALGDLNLPQAEAVELRAKVVKRLLSVPPETIPILLTFVFKRVEAEEAPGLISEVRLNFDKALRKRHEKVSIEIINDCISLSVESIQNSMIRSKPLADTWFKEIERKTDSREHYCVDLLVLLIQHKLTGRRLAVERLILKKLRTEAITTELIQETFQLYVCVLKNLFEELRTIADSLLLTSDPLVVNQGSIFYQEMFTHLDEFYQQEVVEALFQHICCGGGSASAIDSPATASIQVLQNLAENHWEQLVRFSAFAITLLEFLEYMSLQQVKRVMELLARLAYGFAANDEEKKKLASFSAAIQSELLMILKKQLSHTRVEFQRIGVLGSVAVVHILGDPDFVGDDVSNNLQLSEAAASLTANDSSRSGILTGDQRLKQAKAVIDMVTTFTFRVPEVAALFMDEMASSAMLYEVHSSLSAYLNDFVLDTFQANFVVDENEEPINNSELPLSLQYGLNEIDAEPGVSIVFLNIAPMAIREQNRKAGDRTNLPTLTTLVSHFRFLRNMVENCNNVSDIDALLGCAICLPSDEVLENFDTLEASQKDTVCRCLFHAVNWLIEVINTFARAKDMRAKCVQRLRDIVELKEKFFRYLAKNPSFLPPPSVFFGEPIRSRVSAAAGAKKKVTPDKKKKKGNGKAGGKKGKKSSTNVTSVNSPNKSIFHSTPLNSATQMATRLDFPVSQANGTGEQTSETVVQSTYVIHFREIDFAAFLLLSSPLELPGQSPSDISLKPKDLELLLGDFAAKLDHKLLPSAKRSSLALLQQGNTGSEGFAMLDLYRDSEVAKRSVGLLRRLPIHLEAVSGYFQQLIETCDGVEDGPEMFTDVSAQLGRCYYLLMRIMNRILTWHGFQKSENHPMLEDSIRYLAVRLHPEAKEAELSEKLSYAFTYIENFASSLPNFSCAVEQVQLMTTLRNFHRELDSESDLPERLIVIAGGSLKRGWITADGSSEKGLKFYRGIKILLEAYLIISDKIDEDVLSRVDSIAQAAIELLQSHGKEGISESETFRTCNKSTCTLYFNAAFIALVDIVKKIPSSTANHLTPKSVRKTLESWTTAIEMFNLLVNTVKSTTGNKSPSILGSCLKFGKAIVEQFYKSAMPLLDRQFKNFRQESRELLKYLQIGTRTMTSVCNHAKTSNDSKISSYIPGVKKSQEILIYRVKQMLAANGCANAFIVSNLKNKDLQGREIPAEIISDGSENEKDDSSVHESENESDEGQEEAEDDEVTVVTGDTEDSLSRDYD